ncbi:surface lipoprotein assembly modifier [Conchiformibius steedae DSM 2580]|uniref:Surface lipoprotein assembly modifier n=1 Tax=Conchiformibius steedae DSM 2580 TaxID=1121352 RepID=A0AAE9KZB1_9NEIS|nr:porin family protein [Conchiformibius steedae]QMT33901.1 DUF560 domain-containing protein [Conchiformibius steedae]URD66670.1 surface lipoprotein assembly modifier [Conchiformibius steedae DSM 2580]
MKKIPYICLLLPAAAWADGNPYPLNPPSEPEPRFDVAPEPRRDSEPIPPATPAPTEPKKLKVSPEELLQQPELLHRALTSAVLLKNIEGIKVLLPLYQQLPEAQRRDTILIELAQAALAEAEQRPDRAVRHYREALKHEADMPSVRLNLAGALVRDQQNREAQALLDDIAQDPQLPEPAAAAVNAYRRVLKQRSRWQLSAGAHYIRDPNINNTPKQRIIKRGRGTFELPPPETAHGLSYRASAEKDWMLPQYYRIRTGIDLNGKDYWDHSKYDDLSVRAQAGVARQSARSESALLPYYERRWYSGSRYSAEKGIRAEHSRPVSHSLRVSLAGEAARVRHDRRRFLDGASFNASATVLWTPNARSYFTLGTDFSRKRALDPSDAYHRRGMRGSWGQAWGKGFQTVLHAGIGRRSYDAADFFRITRRDTEYNLSLSVWNNKLKLWGVTPRLVGVYQKTRSNHFVYNYRKAYAFIQLSKSI